VLTETGRASVALDALAQSLRNINSIADFSAAIEVGGKIANDMLRETEQKLLEILNTLDAKVECRNIGAGGEAPLPVHPCHGDALGGRNFHSLAAAWINVSAAVPPGRTSP
jgi:hypothetical protein